MYIDLNNISKVINEISRISKKMIVFCEQHTEKKSFYNDKWIHNYEQILKNISDIEHVTYDSFSDKIWSGDWCKYGKIIAVKKINRNF